MSSASAPGTISSIGGRRLSPGAGQLGRHRVTQTDTGQDSLGALRSERAGRLGQRVLYRLGQGALDVVCHRETTDKTGVDVEDEGRKHNWLVSHPHGV